MRHESIYWSWPLATRSAFLINDTSTVEELITLLDTHPVGHLPPILRAERTLARARLHALAGHRDANTDFAAAIAELRAVASPYHLAHALLDHAHHLATSCEPADRSHDIDPLINEAQTIADQLSAQPLRDRITTTRKTISTPTPQSPQQSGPTPLNPSAGDS
jgi:hypothetical protein